MNNKFLFVLLPLIFSSFANAAIVDPTSAQNARLRVTNLCTETVWVQQDFKSTTNDPVVVEIPPGKAYDYSIPEKGIPATRFWPKTGCNAYGYNCKVGESTAVPDAEARGWQKAPYAPDINSKLEATWGCAAAIYKSDPKLCAENTSKLGTYLGQETWWNGSAVDGYTLPYSINVKNHQNTCLDMRSDKLITEPGVDCSGLKPSSCPMDEDLSTDGKYKVINGIEMSHVNLAWKNQEGVGIGCFSPCAKLTVAQGSDTDKVAGGWKNLLGGLLPQSPEAQMYCCPTPPISSHDCSAGPAARTKFSKAITEEQKCNSYTYAYDDAQGLARCGPQTKFEFVVCSKPGNNSTYSDDGSTGTTTGGSTTTQTNVIFVIPIGLKVQYNGQAVINSQQVQVKDGGIVTLTADNNMSCSLRVSDQKVTLGQGSLCPSMTITSNSIALSSSLVKNAVTYTVQFNYNPTANIVAKLNDVTLSNSQKLEASQFSKNSILKVTQNTNAANCDITFDPTGVMKGTNEFCTRLYISKDANNNFSVSLPAVIPNMGPEGGSGSQILFGVDASVQVKFMDKIVTNGSSLPLSIIAENAKGDLVATKNYVTATCTLSKVNNKLVAVSGNLCTNGLVIEQQSNGNFYVGIPTNLPTSSSTTGGSTTPLPVGSKIYQVGLPMGMSLTLNTQIIQSSTVNKSLIVPLGTSNLIIKGTTGTIRTCPITLKDGVLTAGTVTACAGIVIQPTVIYFPAF